MFVFDFIVYSLPYCSSMAMETLHHAATFLSCKKMRAVSQLICVICLFFDDSFFGFRPCFNDGNYFTFVDNGSCFNDGNYVTFVDDE